ncbi:MAG: uroporphyrinogen decarboxylase family protein [Kiritimatiellae bacterium]|nr:uroporphyrinogen decarboxylase family protein [Kiritimatiellia bacterium]
MASMTRRERLSAIFWGRTPDRPAVKIWGADPRGEANQPGFERVRQRAVEKTDLFIGSGSAFHMYAGSHTERLIERREVPTDSPEWVKVITTHHTPQGNLCEVYQKSTCGKPGYEMEYLLKEPSDIRKLLSLPYEPFPFDARMYHEADACVGDRGLALFGLDHAMYALQRLIGSENFALWSLTDDALLLEAMHVFAARLREQVQAAIDAGLGRSVFGWVGPELCIPPLMSPTAFDRYVTALDKPLTELIHNAGGKIWVHCHGKMRPVIGRFADMGVDVLNPIEPPPMGDVSMAEAFEIVGDHMGLEGGVETHDLMTAPSARIHEMVHEVLDAGRGRRLILCPSSGYYESVFPSEDEIRNWLHFIDEGVRYADVGN